jgi:ribosomal protein L37E
LTKPRPTRADASSILHDVNHACDACGRENVPTTFGVCSDCSTPRARRERIQKTPEHVRGLLLEVALEFGLVDEDEL